MKKYGDCVFCGGHVDEVMSTYDYRYHGQLYIFENVPMGKCVQCGEKFITASIAKKLEKKASSPLKKIQAIAIPVISFA
ncbi:MAG: YgiT-type zinc finger protein [Deltaproteobacteria bacterium]|nr:MAG: YgiT-type zinc finger protein [Deltaproteobacteria bacterium]